MKDNKPYSGTTRVALGAALCAALTACGGGGNSGNKGSPSGTGAGVTTSSGTAAIGSAIAGGTVSFTCASGATASTTTGSDGTYSVALKASDYPCVTQVSGGQASGTALASALHSVAAAPGTTNVTPLTDLIVGVLGNGNASGLDGAASGVLSGTITADNLASALAKVRAAIATLPGNLAIPSGFNPLNSQFSVGDANDALLDQYATSLAAAGLSQGDVATKTAAGTPLIQQTYAATAYTTPNLTAIAMGASINLDGTFGISFVDANRGLFSAEAALDSTGNATSFARAGRFTGIMSSLGNRIGELCSAGVGGVSDEQHSQYVYASADLVPVTDPTELNGKNFVEYEDCVQSGTAAIDASGTYTFTEAGSNQSDPGMPKLFSQAFGSTGYRDGTSATVRAKAYKYVDQDGKTTYVYLQVETKNGSTAAMIDGNSNFVLIGVQQPPV